MRLPPACIGGEAMIDEKTCNELASKYKAVFEAGGDVAIYATDLLAFAREVERRARIKALNDAVMQCRMVNDLHEARAAIRALASSPEGQERRE
jgi:hypothetical protein